MHACVLKYQEQTVKGNIHVHIPTISVYHQPKYSNQRGLYALFVLPHNISSNYLDTLYFKMQEACILEIFRERMLWKLASCGNYRNFNLSPHDSNPMISDEGESFIHLNPPTKILIR
jgi:hypothetical protein